MKHWFTLVCALGLSGLAHGQPAPKAMDAESQLRAIREALVEAVLDKPTKVHSAAWIDDHGRLHESSHFQSDVRIRGVRVLAYTQDEAQAPRAQVQLESLPWSVRIAKAAPGEKCEPSPQAWRQPLILTTTASSGFAGPELFAVNALMGQIQAGWKDWIQQSDRWVMDTPRPIPRDTYHQAWLGQEPDAFGWQMHITLAPGSGARDADSSSVMAWVRDRFDGGENKTWALHVVFGQKAGSDAPLLVHWEKHFRLRVDASEISQQPQRWARQAGLKVVPEMVQLFASKHEGKSCDPVQFSVARGQGAQWLVQAGSGSGLKVGDRLLLVNSSKVPGRILEPGTTQHMGIAEVIRIGRRQTELRPLAGQIPPGHTGDWIALPL